MIFKNHKKISIIVPCFNSGKTLKRTIDSIKKQTWQNKEIILVNDGSNDKETLERLNDYRNDSLVKLINQKNKGLSAARNKGVINANGEYLYFLDSDDIWKKRKLEKQISFMNEKNIAFSFTSYQPISENGVEKYSVIKAPYQIDYHSYLINTIIGCLTVIIDREKTGEFQMLNIRSSHDMALWLLIMKRGFSAYGLNENLAYYRIVSTSNTSKKFKAAKEVWDVYRKVEQLNIVYSAICFVGYVYNAIKKRI